MRQSYNQDSRNAGFSTFRRSHLALWKKPTGLPGHSPDRDVDIRKRSLYFASTGDCSACRMVLLFSLKRKATMRQSFSFHSASSW